jgi:hypothetical protein
MECAGGAIRSASEEDQDSIGCCPVVSFRGGCHSANEFSASSEICAVIQDEMDRCLTKAQTPLCAAPSTSAATLSSAQSTIREEIHPPQSTRRECVTSGSILYSNTRNGGNSSLLELEAFLGASTWRWWRNHGERSLVISRGEGA